MTLPFHPLAVVFPMIEGADFDALVEDIRAHGQVEPATVYDGMILDGRNRARACERLGVELKTRPFEGDDPRAFIISENAKRRHLSYSQRSMVAAELVTTSRGGDRKSETFKVGRSTVVSDSEAGEIVGVEQKDVTRAKKVIRMGAPELAEAVRQDKIAVDVAYRLVNHPVTVQLEAVANPDKARHLEKKKQREAHEQALAQKIIALPSKRYGVILADPEWRFIPWSEETGMDRSAANHYATSVLEQIKARNVPSVAADDCVLFMWATAPMLPQALEVMDAWGFEYRSHFIWLKLKAGTGYWFRNVHELLLIGVKGEPPAPAPGQQWESALDGVVGEHSEKPDLGYELAESYFPNLPKLELNATKRRAGWDAWGADAPSALEDNLEERA